MEPDLYMEELCYPVLRLFYKDDIREYDPTASLWRQRKDFPGTRVSAASTFVVGNFVYMKGSGVEFWRYDPINDSWIRKADFKGQIGDGVAADGGFVIDGVVYIVNTYIKLVSANSYTYGTEQWSYDVASDTWTKVVASNAGNFYFGLNGPYRHFSFSLNGTGYLANRGRLYQYDKSYQDVDRNTNGTWIDVQNAVGLNGFSGFYLATSTKAYIWNG